MYLISFSILSLWFCQTINLFFFLLFQEPKELKKIKRKEAGCGLVWILQWTYCLDKYLGSTEWVWMEDM